MKIWEWIRSKLPSWLGGRDMKRHPGDKPAGKVGNRPKQPRRKKPRKK